MPLRRRKILKKSFGSALSVFLVGGFFSLIGYTLLHFGIIPIPEEREGTAQLLITAWFGFLVVLMFWRMAYQYIYYLTYFYDIDQHNLTIRKGIIAKRTAILPFKRITDVYLDQDLWDVALGIYDVHISSPTQESGRFAHIDGVNRAGAEMIRDLVLERIQRE